MFLRVNKHLATKIVWSWTFPTTFLKGIYSVAVKFKVTVKFLKCKAVSYMRVAKCLCVGWVIASKHFFKDYTVWWSVYKLKI